jgi:hypothetical protein
MLNRFYSSIFSNSRRNRPADGRRESGRLQRHASGWRSELTSAEPTGSPFVETKPEPVCDVLQSQA